MVNFGYKSRDSLHHQPKARRIGEQSRQKGQCRQSPRAPEDFCGTIMNFLGLESKLLEMGCQAL